MRFDYDAELEYYAVAHAEDLPMVELVPSGAPEKAIGVRSGRRDDFGSRRKV
jgi:hypothetical protein